MRKARRRASGGRLKLIATGVAVAIAVVLLLIIGRTSAEEARDSSDADIAAASARGREDALQAASMPAGSMQREGAILEIRARETSIRDAGFPTAADSYAAAADSILGGTKPLQ